MNSVLNTEVLIVGAGPAGLMMACQLSINKIPFRIIDKTEIILLNPEPCHTSKKR